MHRSAFIRKLPAVAKIDDVLARDAKKASGLTGGNQLSCSFHIGRIARNTKNTTQPESDALTQLAASRKLGATDGELSGGDRNVI